MKDTAAYNFNLFTHYVKGLIFAGSVLEHDTVPKMKNEWKMIFKRLMTDARNFETQLHKGLGKERSEVEEDTNATIFRLAYNLCTFDGERFNSFVEHLNAWQDPEITPTPTASVNGTERL